MEILFRSLVYEKQIKEGEKNMHFKTKSGRNVELPTDKEDIIITQQAIEDGTNWMDEELDKFKSIAKVPRRPVTDIIKDRI